MYVCISCYSVSTAVDDPLFEQRKRNFRTYDNMIKYYIRNAKKTYFHNTFAMYKNDMKKTWAFISETLNNKKGKMSLYHLNAMVVI